MAKLKAEKEVKHSDDMEIDYPLLYPCFDAVTKLVIQEHEKEEDPERYETEFKLPKISEIAINEKKFVKQTKS